MFRRIEGARSLLAYAGEHWRAADVSEFRLVANAARVEAADALDYAAPENIFIHGGIGATWEHDAHLFYRRAEVSRRLAGGTDAAAEAVAAELLARAGHA
jgi:alkylation response protein AidB-like acyl-CoA dehydrogenase